jgi:hypothetical protein
MENIKGLQVVSGTSIGAPFSYIKDGLVVSK